MVSAPCEMLMKRRMKKKSPQTSPKKSVDGYVKYSGLAFQMILPILIGAYGGIKLDEVLDLQFPVFTVVLSILGVVASIYLLIKGLTK